MCVNNYGRIQVILCYLTLFGTLPEENSLPKNTRENLENKNKFIQLSYNQDILNWINALPIKVDEHVLQAALIQYKDTLEGLCNLREGNIMELQKTIENMKSVCYGTSQEELTAILKNTQTMEQSCKYYIFTKFIIKLGEVMIELVKSKNSHSEVFLTCNQNRFNPLNQQKLWEIEVLNGFSNIGIELSLGKSVGFGLELEDFSPKSNLSFGIMLHGKPSDKSYSLSTDWKDENGTIKLINNDYWKEYVDVSWLLKMLYSPSFDTDGHLDNVASWFF